MNRGKNLWGGRFTGRPDPSFAEFNNSFAVDRRLFEVDIRASVAHSNGLVGAGVLSSAEGERINSGLQAILDRAADDEAYFDEIESEDIHSFVEARLVEMIGDAGRKLHTSRSRNDQVATDLRLWLRDAIDQLSEKTRSTQEALLDLAENNVDTVMPGYTHLQRAQPILFAHWCLAYFEMLTRNRERLSEIRKRVNIMPLGSGAIAGASFAIDRNAVAEELGFEGVSRNSVDAVSDRDFCVEFASACSLIMVAPFASGRRDHSLLDRRVWILRAQRCSSDWLEPDAAEKESGFYGTRAGQSRTRFRAYTGAVDDAQRIAARLQQRHAGRQRCGL